MVRMRHGYTHAQRPFRRRLGRASLALAVSAAVVAGPLLGPASPVSAAAGTSGSPSATTTTRTVTLYPTEATFTDGSRPTMNFAPYNALVVTSNVYRTYLSFGTASLPQGEVTAARLDLQVLASIATKPGLVARSVEAGWADESLTAAQRPRVTSDRLNAPQLAQSGKPLSLELSADAVSAGTDSAFELLYEQSAPGVQIAKSGTLRPRLVVTIAETASGTAPTPTPSPSGSPSTPPTASPTPAPTSSPSASPTPSPTTSPAPSPKPTAQPSTSPAPSPSPSAPRTPSGDVKVLAHYFVPYPLSIDNRDPSSDYYAVNYMPVNGEGGAHASYGGLLRDRPVGRSPLSGDWQMTDMRTEVSQAVDAGIDGFTVDVLSLDGLMWERAVRMMDAADRDGRGFVVVPQLDMTTSAGKASPATIAAKLAELASKPAQYRLADGRVVIGAFKAEAQTPQWWSDVLSRLRAYGHDVAFMPVFLNPSDANIKGFAPISYAMGNWGTRNPGNVLASPNYAAKAHAAGVKWVAPVAVQDERPNQSLYQEAANLETLRATWQRAISDGAEYVQLVAWNDYSENTVFAPSMAHGRVFLDVNEYYLKQFVGGKAPAISRDSLVVTHRIQPVGAQPTVQHKLMVPMSSGGTTTAPRDTVEVLAFLTSPASVTLRSGTNVKTVELQAGVSAFTVPLGLGTVSATATRGGSTVASVTSPFKVTGTPTVQDLQYWAVQTGHW